MNNSISILTNFPQVALELSALEDTVGNKIMTRAMNSTMNQGRTDMARGISKEFRITVGKAKERLSITKATTKGGNLKFEASLEATKRGQGRSMNLIAFVEKTITLAQAKKRMKAGEGGTQTLRSGGKVQKALQLRFQIKRGGGKKVITGAFIGNKGRTVFIRDGKERFPINALNTIDIPQMFNTKRINSVVRKVLIERFGKNFDRELRVVMQGYVK